MIIKIMIITEDMFQDGVMEVIIIKIMIMVTIKDMTIKIIMAVVEEAEDMEVIIITIKIMVTTTKIMIITIEIIMIIIKGMVVMVMLQDGVMVIIEIMVIIIEDMVVMMIRKIMITTMGNPVVGINQENLLPLHLKVKTKITKKMNQNLDHGQIKWSQKLK